MRPFDLRLELRSSTAMKREEEEEKEHTERSRWSLDTLSHEVIACAIVVHRELGAGLLESTYRRCFTEELAWARIPFRMEVPVRLKYRRARITAAYRIDVLVDRRLVVEVKSLETLKWVHEAQVLTYLKHSGISKGLLINFSSRRLVDGLRSFKR